jgi:mRNA interferase MazF
VQLVHHRTGLRHESQLSKDSVINLSQLVALNKNFLIDRVGRIPPARIREVEDALRLVLSL